MTIVGAGRAGSFAALVAGMAGIRQLRIYDDDQLDPERNLAVQLYLARDVRARRPKVEALRELILELVPGITVLPCAERFEARSDQVVDPVALLAVDTMAARASIATKLARRREVAVLLDLRLGRSVMQCFCVRGRSEFAWYLDTLYSDGEAWGECCADSPEPHVAVGAAAFVAAAIRSYLVGASFPRRIALDFDAPALVMESGVRGSTPARPSRAPRAGQVSREP
jgi:molybdopterin/thiamine biosynthesis adenylyltransferase